MKSTVKPLGIFSSPFCFKEWNNYVSYSYKQAGESKRSMNSNQVEAEVGRWDRVCVLFRTEIRSQTKPLLEHFI